MLLEYPQIQQKMIQLKRERRHPKRPAQQCEGTGQEVWGK
jgi:hypothetical protein